LSYLTADTTPKIDAGKDSEVRAFSFSGHPMRPFLPMSNTRRQVGTLRQAELRLRLCRNPCARIPSNLRAAFGRCALRSDTPPRELQFCQSSPGHIDRSGEGFAATLFVDAAE
jgi:hypothetical protein